MRQKSLFFIFLGIFILFLVFSGALVYLRGSAIVNLLMNERTEVLHIQEIPVFFEVTDQKIIGIAVDTDVMNYGAIMKGNIGEKTITIVNPFKEEIKVNISFSEDISEFMEPGFDNFNLLEFNDRLKFHVRLVTVNADLKEYNGSMKVVMTRI
jgi:hypothetical protein